MKLEMFRGAATYATAVAAAGVLSLIAAPAQALTIDATSQGYCRANQTCNFSAHNAATSDNYYSNLLRNWFSFDVPTGTFSAAVLHIWNAADNNGTGGTYNLYAAPGIGFLSLVSGDSIGSVSAASANAVNDGYVNITLNAAGLAAVQGAQGGTFLFGGALTGADPAELLFGFSSHTANLELVTSSAPEPSTWALMLLGVGAMGLTLRRHRSAAA